MSSTRSKKNAVPDANSDTGSVVANSEGTLNMNIEGENLLNARLSALEESYTKSRKDLERLLAILGEREGEIQQSKKMKDSTESNVATSKKRAREAPIEVDGDDDMAEGPPSKVRAGAFEPKPEWSKLMLPSTSSEKNIEVLSSIENLARHANASGAEVRTTLINLIASSPDAKTIAAFSQNGYDIISMLTKQLQKSMKSKLEVRRKPSMKATDYFNQKLATMTQDEVLVKNRRTLLREFVYCDDTITVTQRKKCFELIEKIDFDNEKDEDHMITKVQLERIWKEAKIPLEAGENNQHEHRQRGKHRQQSSSGSSATPQLQQQAHTSGNASATPKPPHKSAKGAKQPKVPSEECRWCNNLGITGAQALHYGHSCSNNPRNATATPLNV